MWSWYELAAQVVSPFRYLTDVGSLLFPVGTTLGLVLLPREASGQARSRQRVAVVSRWTAPPPGTGCWERCWV